MTNLRVEKEGDKPKLMWDAPNNKDAYLAGYEINIREMDTERYEVTTILCEPNETHYVYEEARSGAR